MKTGYLYAVRASSGVVKIGMSTGCRERGDRIKTHATTITSWGLVLTDKHRSPTYDDVETAERRALSWANDQCESVFGREYFQFPRDFPFAAIVEAIDDIQQLPALLPTERYLVRGERTKVPKNYLQDLIRDRYHPRYVEWIRTTIGGNPGIHMSELRAKYATDPHTLDIREHYRSRIELPAKFRYECGIYQSHGRRLYTDDSDYLREIGEVDRELSRQLQEKLETIRRDYAERYPEAA